MKQELMLNLIAQSGKSFWMPESVSTYSSKVDTLFYFIYYTCVAMFLLVTILMIIFAWKYRKRPGHKPQKSPSHSTSLELTWTVIPTVVVLVIFYLGFLGYRDMATPPPYRHQIHVTAYKWAWQFTYANGASSNELVVPRGQPVELTLESSDVIHSVFIPAFRAKKDVVPGRFNKMWFEATELGEYDLFCAEYCGTLHAGMITKVRVLEPSNFVAWLDEAANFVETMSPVEAGAILHQRACMACHNIEGSAAQAPLFSNLFGYERTFADGSTRIADEEYIRESILAPGRDIVAGYQNIMPSFQGRLKDNEIRALTEYIKSLSDRGQPAESWDEIHGVEASEASEEPQMNDENAPAEGSQP